MRRGLTGIRRLDRPALADRERQVLLAWLLGTTKESAARELFVSPYTVKTHIDRIRRKYDSLGRPAKSKVALLLRVIEDGLIEIDQIRDHI
ncbi:LuxR C-terminal-related transcriptional regulator [Mycobacterium sp. ITM-2016-00316]|uniref:response regulator transcription factor n=1 Tax=Mycobacterium sp. ITM-2016-00316 TaxID=2099695 RepID=UPI000CF91368|nr:LuxR C-terminal-related transcriptional regulator [Mycobacterium sp. ITM-2016-00316]WNG85047.1 LuxR C-terminal-related transcriptional regulator [Mycobacterium sp. ITM-2016-00316]